MSRQKILDQLTTKRSKAAFETMWDDAEDQFGKLCDDVKRRKKLSWGEEFAMRNGALTSKLDLQQRATTVAFGIEFEEIRLKASVQIVAADLENGRP